MSPIERRFNAIYEIGCICCRMKRHFRQCQIHHLNLGGKAGQKRRGDLFTIGLCPWHHVGEAEDGVTVGFMRALLGPSLKLESRAFRETFGNDDKLLVHQDELIAKLKARAA